MVSSLRNFVDFALIGKEGTLFDTVEHVEHVSSGIISIAYGEIYFRKLEKRNINVRILRIKYQFQI